MAAIPIQRDVKNAQRARRTFQVLSQQLRDVTPAKLALTASDPPTQAEVQSVADKVDEVIQFLIELGGGS